MASGSLSNWDVGKTGSWFKRRYLTSFLPVFWRNESLKTGTIVHSFSVAFGFLSKQGKGPQIRRLSLSEIESKKTRRKKREREAASALKPFVELVFIFVLQVKQDLWFNKRGEPTETFQEIVGPCSNRSMTWHCYSVRPSCIFIKHALCVSPSERD